ncbi:hypothetical protein EU527_04105 [Candidatus Thorarchaeota archaeon]|nr:MAG: hypothetical protein EU527_04105 [Candidatus Thorarchaeota archaeon]
MVKEIVVLRDSGILLFHYSISGTRKLDELAAAFLSAVGSFAQEVNQDNITVMSFAKNKLVWEKKGDLYFIALVSDNDSGEIHRVILQELAEHFVSTYYSDLRKELPDSRRFRPFTDIVEITLHKFDGIPGLARRYKTILLPSAELNRLKTSLAEVEINRDILRGSLITYDGHVATSNLRSYELEAVLDLLQTHKADMEITEHSCLDKSTGFLLTRVDSHSIAAFVVNLGLSENTYLELIRPFLALAQHISFDDARKFEPDKEEGPITFYDYDGVEIIASIEDIRKETQIMYASSSSNETQRSGALRMVNILGKRNTVADLHESTGLPREQSDQILANLIAKGLVRISRLYPVLEDRDERFAAYLEVIGIKKRDYDIVDSIWKYCNGTLSIREISERSGSPASRILEVLNGLGNNVIWKSERVLSHVR